MKDLFDNEIKKALLHKTENVQCGNLFNNIKYKLNEKGEFYMKFNYKKVIIAVSVLVLLCTSYAVGSSILGGYTVSHSSHLDEITHFPTEKEVMDLVGFVPDYKQSLPNGYEFNYLVPVNVEDYDDTGKKTSDGKEINITYKNKENKKAHISLNVGFSTPEEVKLAENAKSYRGKELYNETELYYTAYTMKCVPPDYKPTDEDRQKVDSGQMDISYGSDEISYVDVQSVIWYKDGLEYCLLSMDTGLKYGDLKAMAVETMK